MDFCRECGVALEKGLYEICPTCEDDVVEEERDDCDVDEDELDETDDGLLDPEDLPDIEDDYDLD